MTIFEFLIALIAVANTVLLTVLIVTVRDGLRTLVAQGNLRRQWAREERE